MGKKLYKLAYTLTEIMIVFVVLGILTAVLLPVARNSVPDENILKFKKAHEQFYNAMGELATSDKYFCDGDLGKTSDGTLITTHTNSYFYNSLAEVLPVKSNFHLGIANGTPSGEFSLTTTAGTFDDILRTYGSSNIRVDVTSESIRQAKQRMDQVCSNKSTAKAIGYNANTIDGVTFFESGFMQFGVHDANSTYPFVGRAFSPPGGPVNYGDKNGFDIVYKIFCIDIDGIPDNVTRGDCKNECPFGYGVRADGKILNGAKADEWLNKEITN